LIWLAQAPVLIGIKQAGCLVNGHKLEDGNAVELVNSIKRQKHCLTNECVNIFNDRSCRWCQDIPIIPNEFQMFG